jgi:Ser/Thr protein kinase RdoA (MazF antagonist)
VKRWGATGLFLVDGERVVVKHASPVLYPHAVAVHQVVERTCPQVTAPLPAHADGPGWQRSIFGHVPGPTVAKAGPDSLVVQARTLAEVQAALAGADLDGLPHYDLATVPDLLLADLEDTGDVDAALVAELRGHLPALRRAVDELIAAVPSSLDHPDVQSTNGLVREDGSVVLLDWEEAVVGCPMLSLYRLRHEADEMGNTAEVDTAYLDALPWGTDAEKRRLAELVMLVAPLKLAIEARDYARALDLPTPHTKHTTTHVTSTLSASRRSAVTGRF